MLKVKLVHDYTKYNEKLEKGIEGFYYKLNEVGDFSSYNYIVFNEEISGDKFNVANTYVNTFSYMINEDNIFKYKWDNDISLDKDFKYYLEDNIIAYKYIDKLYKYYMVIEDNIIEKEKIKTIYKDRVIKEDKDVIMEEEKEECEYKVEVKEKIVEKNNVKETFFYKYRYVCAAIILLTLFLLGYMLYALLKE